MVFSVSHIIKFSGTLSWYIQSLEFDHPLIRNMEFLRTGNSCLPSTSSLAAGIAPWLSCRESGGFSCALRLHCEQCISTIQKLLWLITVGRHFGQGRFTNVGTQRDLFWDKQSFIYSLDQHLLNSYNMPSLCQALGIWRLNNTCSLCTRSSKSSEGDRQKCVKTK